MEEKSGGLTLQNIFLLGIFVVLFFVIVFMMKPFATVLLWTVLLYVLIRPLYLKAVSKLNAKAKYYRVKQHLLAGGFALGVIVLIIAPITMIVIQLVQQGISFLQSAEKYIAENSAGILTSEGSRRFFEFVEKLDISLPELNAESIRNSVTSLLHTYSSNLIGFGKTVVSKTGSFLVSLAFIVFALYFCFLDGPYLSSLLKKAVPINPVHMRVLTRKFSDIIKNLFSGYILVVLFQGVMSFVIMTCFGVPAALLLSVVLMVASFIPLFGAAIVWFPVGIIICLTVSPLKGILFLLLSAVGISFLDNFLRPLFLKDRIHVHPLVIFFAILGGIKMFGMNGLILGPLAIILFFTVLDLLVTKSGESEKSAEIEAIETEK